MNSTNHRSIRTLALLSMLAAAIALTTAPVATAGPAAGSTSNSEAKQIQGAWLLHVSSYDCITGASVENFYSVLTFAQGGTLTNVTTSGSPAMRTTGLGTWKKAGGHKYTAVTTVFLFSPTGAWAATQRLANTFDLGINPDELTGITEATFFDTHGNVTFTGCANVVGHRIE